MSNLFNMDNGFFRALGRLADLMILNIVFIICCIPVFTIGASCTAMYYVTLKLAENEEGYIIKSFWKSFKQNFKQATVIWLIMLLIGTVLVLDLLIMRSTPGTFANILRIIITATAVIYFIVLSYVFPVLARFYNSIKGTFKNSFLMAVANLPRTIMILIIPVIAVGATFLNSYTLWYGVLIWLMAGFALVAYANSYFLKSVFAKYMPDDENSKENPDAWNLDSIEKTALDVDSESTKVLNSDEKSE